MSQDHYWPEIDGLRAIAIVLVVLFHAGLPQVGGGFIGVDVFFVLSGYLITGLLAREIARTGWIDLVDFYARRARRLMPALAVVLVTTLVAGAYVLVPVGEQQGLGKSAIAASAFLANIFFWRTQSGYFAGASEELPLLHLWTLAVEEQFYIVWPLVMIGVGWVLRRRPSAVLPAIAAMLALGSVMSFAASVWVTPMRTTLAFYTMPFRAWEFGVGALLALVPIVPAARGLARVAGAGLIVAGLAAVVAAALIFSSATVFPGIAAALPVLGTAAAIAGVRIASGSMPARLLAVTPMVWIGKLSYSWYLWHWPLLALGRAQAMGEHSALRDGVLVLLALALSAATFRWIEEPVRRLRPWPFVARWESVAAGLALMMGTAALAGILWWGAEQRAAREPGIRAAAAALDEKAQVPPACTHFRSEFTGLAPVEQCAHGHGNGKLLLLWGDLHAFHYVPAVQTWATTAGARVVPRAMGSCKPQHDAPQAVLAENMRGFEAACIAFNKAVMASLLGRSAPRPDVVALAARWSVPSVLQNGLGSWEAGLDRLVKEIRAAGVGVVLIAEAPRPLRKVPICVARLGAKACGRPREDAQSERAAAVAALRRIAAANSGVAVIDPIDALCTRERCTVARDGIVLYSDDSHLSVAASRALAPLIGAGLEQLAKAGR